MVIDWLIDMYEKLKLRQLRRAGLVMPDDCRLSDLPRFDSEPYLITIGHHVAIASKVSFITHDGGTHVFRNEARYRNVIKYGRINILDNCVIGQGTIILPGVTIGPNSVIAAGSVVSRNIPPGVLAGGNPARPIMTIHQYAEWSLAGTPEYDPEAYRRDKKACLMNMAMRGAAPQRSRQGEGAAGSARPGCAGTDG
jgi:acetyltransferase-like isoleucine patch superfamily enzyme